MALLIFWVCLLVLVYVYAGYPALLRLVPKRDAAARRDLPDDELPAVSLVIAAYNEEAVIDEKVRNALALDYPKERLEIWVASDGCTDGTNKILRGWETQGIKVNYVSPRGGKTRALNLTVPRTTGDLLVFSDANAMYRPDALRKLVRHFQDPSVGGVTGDVRLLNDDVSFGQSEGLYYRYERFIQLMESRFHSIIGVDGAMYAIRRELFVPPSDNIILDDFVISMTVARQGFRVLYDPEAVATESATPDAAQEFRRKIRISAGAAQAIKQREGLPSVGQGKLLLCYVSHKVLRWLSPFFLLGLLFANLHLVGWGLGYGLVLLAQLACYGAALAGVRRNGDRMAWWIQVPFFFALQNAAYLVGVVKGLLVEQRGTWDRTGRDGAVG
jgi:cellulose synthase/poly-beta-1,6-N-acetylglucosamine synthase-like glycosyltransferase